MRAKRIDEIRRGGDPLDKMRVGRAGTHPAYDALAAYTDGFDTDHRNDVKQWTTLKEYTRNVGFSHLTLTEEISREMCSQLDVTPDRIVFASRMGTSDEFDVIAESFIESPDAVQAKKTCEFGEEMNMVVNEPAGILTLQLMEPNEANVDTDNEEDFDGKLKETYDLWVLRAPEKNKGI